MLAFDHTNKWATGQLRYGRQRIADITAVIERANNAAALRRRAKYELNRQFGPLAK